MKISENITKFVASFEGLYTTSYKCPAGVWTIGYGHTKGVKQGMKISKITAEKYLQEDLTTFEKSLAKTTKYKNCDVPRFKEMAISFAFNCGVGNWNTLTNNSKRNWLEILEHIGDFNHAKVNGKYQVLNGLTRRRKEEKEYALKFYGTEFYGLKSQGINRYEKSTTELYQAILNKLYNSRLTVDGVFGSKTRKAIIDFQKKTNRKQDGILHQWELEYLLMKVGLIK